ncbi:MAG: hypothetical protein LBI69_03785 [Puniceicoccales bacterium]|jgi:hypothetical protein|nr:hypothetical protein [Puniceicoccales bacterium]
MGMEGGVNANSFFFFKISQKEDAHIFPGWEKVSQPSARGGREKFLRGN